MEAVQLLTALITALYHSKQAQLLPTLYATLPTSLLTTAIPPTAFILTAILPSGAAIPPIVALSILHQAAHPLISLAAAWQLAGYSARSSPWPRSLFLLFLTLLLANFLPTSQLPMISPHLAPLLLSATVITYLHTTPTTNRKVTTPRSQNAKPPVPKPPRRTRRRQTANILRLLPTPVQAILPFVLTYLITITVTGPLGTKLSNLIYPRHLPPSYKVLAQSRGQTGLISVVQVKHRYRMLIADTSVLGGRYTTHDVHPDSIFGEFHLHEAVRLAQRKAVPAASQSKDRVLLLGIGIGIVAQSFHEHAAHVDAVELDPLVADYARRYFGLQVRNVHVEDALSYVQRHQNLEDHLRYDYVIHDLFTGCSVPPSLFSIPAWQAIRAVLKPDGVLAVNFVGALDDPPTTPAIAAVALIYDRLERVFGNVRLFSDGHTTRTHNLVFFASRVREGVRFRKPVSEDYLGSPMREEILNEFEQNEVFRERLGAPSAKKDAGDWVLHMGQWDTCWEHLRLMSEIHPKSLWPALFAHEQLNRR